MEYYSTIKENEILPPTVTWTSLEGIMLSEMHREAKTKYCMISLIVQSKKYNKPVNITKNIRFTDTESKPVVTSGKGGL